MPEPLRIGLAGLGTVGAGVVRMLQAHGATIAARAGRPVEIAAVSARSRHRDRGVDLAAYAWEDDPVALARRADVDLVVEVDRRRGRAGQGDGRRRRSPAASTSSPPTRRCSPGTARRWPRRAEANGVALRFEAAVAGRHPGRQGADRGARRQRDHPGHGGDERHLQLHPDPDGGGGRALRRRCSRRRSGSATPRPTRRSTSAASTRRRSSRCSPPTAFGTRVDFDGIDGRGHRAGQPRRHRARGRARLPHQAARRRADDRGRARGADAALPGARRRRRSASSRASPTWWCSRATSSAASCMSRPRRRRRRRPPRRSSATSSTSRAAW